MTENERRIYCGNSFILPRGYDALGTPYECLKKGVGVGIYIIPEDKIRRARANRKPFTRGKIIKIAQTLNIDIYRGRRIKPTRELINEIKQRLG